jgi:hypothetical protein
MVYNNHKMEEKNNITAPHGLQFVLDCAQTSHCKPCSVALTTKGNYSAMLWSMNGKVFQSYKMHGN